MYKYGEYLLDTGWGGKGIYDVERATGLDPDGRHIIPSEAIMAGTGSGYEEVIFNDVFCETVTIIMNYSQDKVANNLHQLLTLLEMSKQKVDKDLMLAILKG